MYIAWCDSCAILVSCSPRNHLVVADGMAPICRQDICNQRDDVNRLVRPTWVVSHLIMMCKPVGEFYLVALIYWFRFMYVERKLGILVDPSRAANLLRPGDLYMRQGIGSSLIQIMACHLFSDKPCPEAVLTICFLNSQKQTSGIFKSKYKCFLFQQNAFENVVCKMAVVLSKPQFIIIIWVVVCEFFFFNSSPPRAACMRQWTRSALVQVMACRLFTPSHYLN